MSLTHNKMVPCCLLVVLIIMQMRVENVEGDCILSLNKDFGNPSPVFLQNGRYLAPNSEGAILVRRSDTILVACPGDKRHIMVDNKTSGYSELEAHCINNDTFRVGRWIGPFKSIKCNTQPWFTTEATKEECYGDHHMLKVGYKVHGAFHTLYQACFDEELITTYYVVHELSPKNKHIQQGQRPQFIEGSLFGKVRMSELYKVKKQTDRINTMLGANNADEYISNKQFLTRGHLAPRADFPMRAEQRASFHYVNTAPQWMRGNAGDWAALEELPNFPCMSLKPSKGQGFQDARTSGERLQPIADVIYSTSEPYFDYAKYGVEALRRRVQSLNHTVTVYTGTHSVMTLADQTGRAQPFYLDVDANNNGLVPVPMYFYKVVYDKKTQKATVFISINSSFYNDDMINNLVFCEDVCGGNSQFNWLRWRANDGTFSFCCEYEEFAKVVKHLPRLHVKGLFY